MRGGTTEPSELSKSTQALKSNITLAQVMAKMRKKI